MMRPSAGLRSLFANASYGVAGKLIAIGLRLVYVLALARLLGAADYGLYVYALSWYVIFMPLTNLGQDLDLGRAVGGRRPDAAQVVAATFTLRVYAAVAVMVGVLAAGWALNPDERGRLLVTLMALAVLPRALAVWTQMVCLVHERSALILRQETAFRLLEATLGIGVLRFPKPDLPRVKHTGNASNMVIDSIHRSILENMRDGVISLDLEGTITTFLASDRVALGTGLAVQAPESGRSK